MDSDSLHQAVWEAIKIAPPATVSTLTFMGYPISEDVQAVMLVYALGLVLHMTYSFIRWVCRAGWNE